MTIRRTRSGVAATLTAATTAICCVSAVQAATINGWNTDNVLVGPVVTGTDAGESVVYDRSLPDAAALTSGKIVYAAPEADSPGLKVVNGTFTESSNTFDGCIMASSSAVCDSPFQSGKRFKMQATDGGPIDLVFDVTADGSDKLYRVFDRIINVTDKPLSGFRLELGTGIGDAFTPSGAGDGLSFGITAPLGPDGLTSFSQYPFGLFGSLAVPNPSDLNIAGFFDTSGRAGFSLSQTEDLIQSGDYNGAYEGLFGNWLTQGAVPDGLLWDYDGVLGTADPLVMAWDNGTEWEVRRGIDDSLGANPGVIETDDIVSLDPGDWQTFAYGDIGLVETYLSGISLFDDAIEDLANLNVNYSIALGSGFAGDSFTIRTVVAPVPLPTTAPLLLGGLVVSGMFVRRRRRARGVKADS